MIEGLLFDEARAIVSNLESQDLDHWWAWKEEWPDWREVSEVEGLTEMIYRPLHVSPPPPPKDTEESSFVIEQGPLINRLHPTTDPDTISKAAGQFLERTKRRYRKRYQITVVDGPRKFQTFCKDISVGGINLEDELPAWVQGYFKVHITKPNSRQVVELTCSLLDPASTDRHRLLILPLESEADEQNLEQWLAA